MEGKTVINLDENNIKLKILEIASGYAGNIDTTIELYKKILSLFRL